MGLGVYGFRGLVFKGLGLQGFRGLGFRVNPRLPRLLRLWVRTCFRLHLAANMQSHAKTALSKLLRQTPCDRRIPVRLGFGV